MKLHLQLCCAVLLVIALSGTGQASMVTVVPGDAPLEAASAGPSAIENIVLTFGDEKVIIHEAPLGMAGETVIHRDVSRDKLFLVRDRRAFSNRQGYDVLYSYAGFRLAVVERPQELSGIKHVSVKPVTGSRIVIEKPEIAKAVPDPTVEAVLARLNATTYKNKLSALSYDLTSRYLCTSRVLTARDLIAAYFRSLGLTTYVVKIPSACWPTTCTGPQGYNVIGIKKGKVFPQRFCLVGAHYDSINENNPCGNAPGSNDNASGAAGVMELARVFSKLNTELTLVFAAFSGEEEDLYGSTALAKSMMSATPLAGLKAANMRSFVILDMISYHKNNFGITVEGSNTKTSQTAAIYRLVNVCRTYSDLAVVKTFDYEGSDHEPFLDRGMAGGLIIETDWDAYDYYHTGRDVLAYQDIPYAIQVLKVAAAMLATDARASFP